jgi:hypothetical protein
MTTSQFMLVPDPGRTATRLLLSRFIRMDMALAWRSFRRRVGMLKLADVSVGVLDIPDTQLAKAAYELAREVSPDFLLFHAARSWGFGAIFAARDQLKFDREAFFVAAILHDLGVASTHAEADGSFEWVGARAAMKFCGGHHVTPERQKLIGDAIALHASVGIASGHSPEASLVHFGAGCDVVGLRIDEVPPEMLQAVLERWPREEFKKRFPPLLVAQAEKKPQSHIAGHVGLGFAKRVAAAPFSE